MKSLTINIPRAGLYLKLKGAGGADAQVVIVAPDEVLISEAAGQSTLSKEVDRPIQPELFRQPVRTITAANGFPPRQLTKQAIIQIIREHNGSVRIRDVSTGWNIYDEVAARLGVSIAARRRPTPGTGESAWRPEVGFARKDLEQAGILQPTEQSGRGVWAFKSNT